MSRFDDLIATAKAAGMTERKQFLQYILNIIQQSKRKLPPDDTKAILDFAYEQLDVCIAAIPEAPDYREKDLIFEVGDFVLGIIMHLCGAPASVPKEKLMKIQALVQITKNERKIETTLEEIIQQDSIQETDVNRLLYWVRQTNDEYQRGMLCSGLIHYRSRLSAFSDGARAKLSQHIEDEMERILALDSLEGDPAGAMEMAVDICRDFPTEKTPSLLLQVLQMHQHQISYFAVESLLSLNHDIPQAVIDDLANDLAYARITYATLTQHGKEHLFPVHLNNPEYLAKSDLVHWLTYPTELGKAPDEIEYIGKITYLFKKEVYYVFKYRSDSTTLGEELQGKWLIGWSSDDGGTFSNFDEFEKFDMGSTEKTLKNIKKKLIG